MKKAGLFIAFVFLILFLSFVSSVSAQAPGLEQAPLGNEIQQGQQQYEQYEAAPNKTSYLQQEWGKMIAKMPVIGSIHNFSTNNPLPFRIAFAEPYSFSLVFFMIVVLWILAAINATKLAKATGFINKNLCWIAGILIAVIVAQTKLYSFISNSVLSIIFSNDAWWARMIIGIVVIGVIMIVNYFGGALSTSLKKNLEKRKEEQAKLTIKQRVKKLEAFVKGAEEGTAIAK